MDSLVMYAAAAIFPTLFGACMLLGAEDAAAQSYPNKPIRIVAGSIAGSGDVLARIIAQGLVGGLGQRVVIDNRTSGVVLGEVVANAQPDGYTLLFTGSSLWLAPFLQDNLPWNPVKDFKPITLAVITLNLVVVHPLLPAKSVKELIALAKAKPGELNYATSAIGSSNHLAAELFNSMAGVRIVQINYKTQSTAFNDLIGGQVQVMFPSAASSIQLVKSGKLRALAVTSAQPSAIVPGLPTVTESGLPGFKIDNTFGMFAPANTSAAIINRLNREIVQLLNTPDAKEKFLMSAGAETVGSSPEELAAAMKSEMTRLGKVIVDAGIRAE